MTEVSSLQKKMLEEMKDHDLFQKAESFGLEYLSKALERNVYPSDKALSDLKKFDEELPSSTGDAYSVLQQLNDFGGPATVTTIGSRYFGFVTGSVLPASLAAKNLSIFWDQVSAMQVISPLCSKLETIVEQWLVQLFGLPKGTAAGFVSGSSMANFCGLAAARYRILKNQGWDITEKGLFDAPKIRVVTGRHAHSTVLKAISLIGLGKANIEWVDVDDQGRIIVDQIPELDNRTILILQAGNVSSGSFDDFKNICEKAKNQGAWIHIDGAFGLWAQASESLKHLTKGIEYANSWAVDAHKTLNTPYDSGIIMCRDKEALVSALHMTGGYIVIGEGRDGMYYTPEMSRRARIIELWAAMKYLGKAGIDQLVTDLHLRAAQFANEIKTKKGFKVLNDIVFNQVLVQCDSDEITDRTISKIQELRTCWAGGSTWFGKKVIRVSVCSWATTPEDITKSVNSFEEALSLVQS
ncbi:MAG: aminotransferase class V-fold PLP-dependent enzyme [Cyclobacteriaceae bacterium]|nr:aspartate aminotransferase family protein [Cyclobacteriaceae bacterium]